MAVKYFCDVTGVELRDGEPHRADKTAPYVKTVSHNGINYTAVIKIQKNGQEKHFGELSNAAILDIVFSGTPQEAAAEAEKAALVAAANAAMQERDVIAQQAAITIQVKDVEIASVTAQLVVEQQDHEATKAELAEVKKQLEEAKPKPAEPEVGG